MSSKKVIILDDHTLFLKGMALILKECCVDYDVYTYQSIKKIKSDNLKFEEFDLLISDIEIPGEDTFELFTLLRKDFPGLPILVVSMHKKNAVIKRCKTLNIEGYLLKDEDSQLTGAIETIINGGKYYSKAIVDFCRKNKNSYKRLTVREEEIIRLIVGGYGNQDIADKLFLSIETVKSHKKNIKIKLDVDYTTGIIEYANKNILM